MTIKRDHDEIWYWYQKLEDAKKSHFPPKAYCTENRLDYKMFNNMKYRIEYKKDREPELYAQLEVKARKYMKSGIAASKFARENDVPIKFLSEMVTHLGYRDIIDKMKGAEESKPMQFIQVPAVIAQPQQELLKKQNEVELIISAGVKVVVAPEVGADKLIRIIELLKDL